MQLHQLKPQERKYPKRRVGRGGKRGTYSGRGTKGQKARAGHRIRPAERDFIQRLPKLRGFKNPPVRPKPQVVNLKDLSKIEIGNIINPKTLAEAKIIRHARQPIKILAVGELKKPLIFKGVQISKKAKEKIEKAGGTIE